MSNIHQTKQVLLKSSPDEYDIHLLEIDVSTILQNPDDVDKCPICEKPVYGQGEETFTCLAYGHECCGECYHKNPKRDKCSLCNAHGMNIVPEKQRRTLHDMNCNKAIVCCPMNNKSLGQGVDGADYVISVSTDADYTYDHFTNIPRKRKICQWEGHLHDFDDHVKSCFHFQIPCPYCQGPYHNVMFDEHLKECDFRPMKCKLCSQNFPFRELESHHMKCEKRVVACLFNCGKKFPYEELDSHLDKECPNMAIKCPWRSKLGCLHECTRKEMGDHLKDIDSHLSLPNLIHCEECKKPFDIDLVQEHFRQCGRKKCSNAEAGCCFEGFDEWILLTHETGGCLFQTKI